MKGNNIERTTPRKHISIKIDQELGCQLVWIQRDKETGSDLFQLVVFFPSLLWKKFELATYHKPVSEKLGNVIKARIEELGAVDLFYWRPHF